MPRESVVVSEPQGRSQQIGLFAGVSYMAGWPTNASNVEVSVVACRSAPQASSSASIPSAATCAKEREVFSKPYDGPKEAQCVGTHTRCWFRRQPPTAPLPSSTAVGDAPGLQSYRSHSAERVPEPDPALTEYARLYGITGR